MNAGSLAMNDLNLWGNSPGSLFWMPPGRNRDAGGPSREDETAQAPLVPCWIQLSGLHLLQRLACEAPYAASAGPAPVPSESLWKGPVQGVVACALTLPSLLCGRRGASSNLTFSPRTGLGGLCSIRGSGMKKIIQSRATNDHHPLGPD